MLILPLIKLINFYIHYQAFFSIDGIWKGESEDEPAKGFGTKGGVGRAVLTSSYDHIKIRMKL